MAQPVAYIPATAFTAYEATQPWFPGQEIDAEAEALQRTTDGILDNLALIQRDDGGLRNRIVGYDQLDSTIQRLLLGGFISEISETPGDLTAMSIYNIKSAPFSARCLGLLADDSDAIAAAITAANATGNVIIWVPASTMITRAMPAITANNVTIKGPPGTVIYGVSSSNVTFFPWTGTGTSGTTKNVASTASEGFVVFNLSSVGGLSAGDYLFFRFTDAPFTITGTTHSNTTVDGIVGTYGIAGTYGISGSGIPAGTTVSAVTDGVSLVLSQAATASATVTLTITPTYEHAFIARIRAVTASATGSGTLTNKFSVTSGNYDMTVEHTAHGRAVGDPVSFASAGTPIDSHYVQGVYAVKAVVDADHYTIELYHAASSSVPNGGGIVTYAYPSCWIDTPFPFTADPTATTHSIQKWTPLVGGGMQDIVIDGSYSTGSCFGISALHTKGTTWDVRLKGLKSNDHVDGNSGCGFNLTFGLQNTIRSGDDENCGSGAQDGINIAYQTYLHVDNINSRNSNFGFGLDVCSYFSVGKVHATHSRARGVKLSRCLIGSVQSVLSSDSILTNFAFANATRHVRVGAVHTRGGAIGIWFSDGANTDNYIGYANLGTALDPLGGDLQIYPSDQRNVIEHLQMQDITRIYNGGGALIRSTKNTGWADMVGTSNKASSFDVTTVTLPQLAQRVNALQQVIAGIGQIGA